MTGRKVASWLKQIVESAKPAVPVELPTAENEMVSEGNPNTHEAVKTPVVKSEAKAPQQTDESAECCGGSSSPAATGAETSDQEKRGDAQPLGFREDAAELHSDQLSEVQWGRRRIVGASWEEGLGLAFLRRSIQAIQAASSLQQHGVHAGEDGRNVRTGEVPAELKRVRRAAVGKSP